MRRAVRQRQNRSEDRAAHLEPAREKRGLRIDDLSDRMAMLGDVTGQVGLMKRDLGELMRSVRGGGSV